MRVKQKAKEVAIPVVLAALLLLTGCLTITPYGLVLRPREMQSANCELSPRYADYAVSNVAILPFEPSPKTESGMYTPMYATRAHTPIPKYVHLQNDGETASRLNEKELLGTARYRVVDRRKLDEVVKELELQLSDLVRTEDVKRIGNLTGADAVLTGTVNQALAALQWQSYGDLVYSAYIGYVHLELRLTHVETGDVIWICNIQRNSLNYIDEPITIAQSPDVDRLQQFGGPSENGVILYVLRKAAEEAIARLK